MKQKKGSLAISEIPTADRVRILQNPDIPRHFRNQFGTVIEIRRHKLSKDEATVRLDSGGTTYVMKHDLTKID